MRVILACLGALFVVGCSETYRSTLPPYVRDVRPMQGGIEMISCGMTLTITEKRGWWSSNETESDLKENQCWRVVIPTTIIQPAVQQ